MYAILIIITDTNPHTNERSVTCATPTFPTEEDAERAYFATKGLIALHQDFYVQKLY